MGMPMLNSGRIGREKFSNVSSFWILVSCRDSVRNYAANFSDTSVRNADAVTQIFDVRFKETVQRCEISNNGRTASRAQRPRRDGPFTNEYDSRILRPMSRGA